MSEFKISAALDGHSDDVRAVAFPTSKAVVSASRDATVRIWNLVSNPPPTYDYNISSHGSAFINTLAFLPPTAEYPEGLLLSAGHDTIIEARQPGKAAEADADALLLGHQANVCALDVCPEGGWIVSGSWDSTARVWMVGKWETEAVLDGHQGNVWAVLAYDKDTIVTGCADHFVRVFHLSGRLQSSFRSVDDVVRALCKIPKSHPSGAQIAVASNDGVIRLWTLQGEPRGELHGHESFIYSLATLPSGELLSAGEDRTVRVWAGQSCIQTITHPAITVWSVAACQENGDIVTGASDRVVRIFSRSEERQGAEELVRQFETSVKESSIPQQQVGNINKETLPGPEFLKQKLGTKEGQVQMIRETDGSVTAHTWASASRQWVTVGTVVNSVGSSGKKVEYLGQDYDYVFDVDIEEGKPPLKLPYNLSQNPYEVATKFIQDNQLPVGYLEQVANFIVANTKGATIGSSSETQAVADSSSVTASQAGQSLSSTRQKVLPQTSYLSIKTANMKPILKKLQDLNSQLVFEGSKDISLNPAEMETIAALCGQLEQSSVLKEARVVDSSLPVVMKVATKWPTDMRLPGLDLLRLLAASSPRTAIADCGSDTLISAIINSGVFEPPLNLNNVMLAVRAFANLFETEPGRDLAMRHFTEIMKAVTPEISTSGTRPNRNLTIAINTLFINISVFVTTPERAGRPGSAETALELVDSLTKIITDNKDSESVYRGLVALGTLIVGLGGETKVAAKDIYNLDKLLSVILDSPLGIEPRMKNVAGEIRDAVR